MDVSKSLGPDNKYMDNDFLPNQDRIGPEKIPEAVLWKKPSEIFKDEYFVFEGNI